MLKEVFRTNKKPITLTVIVFVLLTFLPIFRYEYYPICINPEAPCPTDISYMPFITFLTKDIFFALLLSIIISYVVASFVVFAARKKK